MKQRVVPVEGLVHLSDLIIRHPEVQTFEELLVVVAMAASDGARFLDYDIKPDYRDTPKRWEPQVERVFMQGPRYLGDPAMTEENVTDLTRIAAPYNRHVLLQEVCMTARCG